MNRKGLAFKLQRIVEEEIPSGSVNLWKKIEQNLGAANLEVFIYNENRKFYERMPRRNLKFSAVISGMTLLLIAFLIFTPQGKIIAQTILQFFTRSEQNAKALPVVDAELVPQTAEAQPSEESNFVDKSICGTIQTPSCTLEKVQDHVAFDIHSPSELPERMKLIGSVPIGNGVLIKYEGPQGTIILAEIQNDQEIDDVWEIGKDAEVISTQVGNNPAEYLKGAWAGLGLDEEQIIPWDVDQPIRVLRWQFEDLMFTLVNFPARTPTGPIGLELSQMVLFAEGLTQGVGDIQKPEDDSGISLEEAEKLAGYDFVIPAWMPEGFNQEKIVFNSQHNAICQAFNHGRDINQPAIVIAQSSWALPEINEIQVKAFFDSKPVEIALTEQTLTLQGVVNHHALFVETGLDVNTYCGGNLGNANRALLWQIENKTFIIFGQLDANDGRGYITKREMILLAESLNGFTPDAETANVLDAERLHSKSDAEELTGMKIKFPTVMLSNVWFDHIASHGQESENPMISTFFRGDPVGDGRYFHVSVFQSPYSQNTLEELMLAGGFNPIEVNENPGIYQAQCWDSTIFAGGIECHQMLTWFEGDTQFDIISHFQAEISKEKLLAIAESMN